MALSLATSHAPIAERNVLAWGLVVRCASFGETIDCISASTALTSYNFHALKLSMD